MIASAELNDVGLVSEIWVALVSRQHAGGGGTRRIKRSRRWWWSCSRGWIGARWRVRWITCSTCFSATDTSRRVRWGEGGGEIPVGFARRGDKTEIPAGRASRRC